MEENTQPITRPMWFINDYYSCAGGPKMEAWLMDTVISCYMGRLVYEEDLPAFVASIERIQEEALLAKNRWKKVRVELSSHPFGVRDDLRHLYIGDRYISLKKVNGWIVPRKY